MRETKLCAGNRIGIEIERKEEDNNANKSGYQTTKFDRNCIVFM